MPERIEVKFLSKVYLNFGGSLSRVYTIQVKVALLLLKV